MMETSTDKVAPASIESQLRSSKSVYGGHGAQQSHQRQVKFSEKRRKWDSGTSPKIRSGI